MTFRLTDYAENKFADMVRGVDLSLPASWYFGIMSAANESSLTELSGTGYARIPILRSLTNFAGTQGYGTVLASSGTSHTTSNNVLIDWGTAGAAWGAANYIGMFDASTAGNCWIYLPAPIPVVIGSSDSFSVAIGEFAFSFGLTGGMSDYLSNKLIDRLMRAQSFTFPASMYARLFTVLPTNAGGGTEVVGASYSRPAIAGTTTAWSGTQSAGSTSASTGSSGRISNNAALSFAAPPSGEDWGDVEGAGLQDAASAGNLLFWGAFTGGTQTLVGGTSAPSFEPNTLAITFG